jgi:hypothetical protein
MKPQTLKEAITECIGCFGKNKPFDPRQDGLKASTYGNSEAMLRRGASATPHRSFDPVQAAIDAETPRQEINMLGGVYQSPEAATRIATEIRRKQNIPMTESVYSTILNIMNQNIVKSNFN